MFDMLDVIVFMGDIGFDMVDDAQGLAVAAVADEDHWMPVDAGWGDKGLFCIVLGTGCRGCEN